MNKRLSLLTAALLLAGASSAFAASSTDLTVTGTITPSACTPTLLNGGIIELGKVSSKGLNADRRTIIDTREVGLTVNCDAATRFALLGIDSRLGSSAHSSEFGLGLINIDQKLGSYKLTILNPMADGVQVQPIASSDGQNNWYFEDWWEPHLFMSVASMADGSQPVTVKDLTLDLQVTTSIARTDGLDLTSEVPIDGLATLEVKYL